MEITRLSTKGQIVIPKGLRTARAWAPGTELIVEEAGDGLLLRRAARFPRTSLEEVAGCLRSQGRPRTLAEMKAAVEREVDSRHDRGRY
jgi:AbrB family looped-hinge helix DNA binding protein